MKIFPLLILHSPVAKSGLARAVYNVIQYFVVSYLMFYICSVWVLFNGVKYSMFER